MSSDTVPEAPAPEEGRIRVPRDLDAITDVDDEDHTDVDPRAMERIWLAARSWYAAGMQPAIQVCVRHRGRTVLNRAIGHARGNGPGLPSNRDDAAEPVRVTVDTPFCTYSTAKGVAVTVLHRLIERGDLDLEARVADYMPEFTSDGKDRITVRHVLTHSAGIPINTGPKPDLKRSEDSEYTRAMLAGIKPVYSPGRLHFYHALTWGPLVRELVLAATGRTIREIAATEILDPLGFRWTNFGVAPDDATVGNVVDLYHDGEEAFRTLCEAVAGARRYIHLEYYIFQDDETGRRLLAILAERARAGVEVSQADAEALLALPRTLGHDPADGEPTTG